jgi:hypothetical protein
LQKERNERMALMPDEDFEGDFLEVQENQGITNAARALLIRSQERYEKDFRKRIKMHYQHM